MTRRDPYRNFRFRIEIDQIQRGGFSRVKGLTRETRFESYREGGVNDHEHKLATLTTYGPLILERGLVDDYLWSWHEAVIEGRIQRRNLTLTLQDESGQDVWRWLVEAAFPSKWGAADLDGGASQILVESVEIVHHGVRKG